MFIGVWSRKFDGVKIHTTEPKMKFQIVFQTENEKTRELCTAFWETDADGNFRYKLSDLTERFQVSQNAIRKIVQENCYVFSEEWLCKKSGCSKPAFHANNRNQAQHFQRHQCGTDYDYCDECRLEMNRQAELQAGLEGDILKKEKTEKMREAFENGIYESLSPRDFDFLLTIASSINVTAAIKNLVLPSKRQNHGLTDSIICI
jgi:hypothetical protein